MTSRQTSITFALLVCGTVIGLAGIDLVLPAIPSLPKSLAGTLESAQLVLASFAAGTAIGLIIFGELGARKNQRIILIAALALYAFLSFLASQVTSINQLIVVRFFQGVASSAPAVFAPGMIKAMFSQRGALKAIGLMGSIESLTPAFAPVVGAWLLTFGDWRLSFFVTASLAGILCISIYIIGGSSLKSATNHNTNHKSLAYRDTYRSLFKNRAFMRHALSHACTLGGLLVFVFGAPTVIITSMGGDLIDFNIMQIIGVSLFIISANLSARLVDRFGSDTMIFIGSSMTALGCLGILLFSYAGNNDPRWLWALFIPVNLGLGFRGPPGFYQAIVAAGDNDSRGAALLILFILGLAATGTTVVAPFITMGLLPLALVASLIGISSVVILQQLKY
jgi:MFS family permease